MRIWHVARPYSVQYSETALSRKPFGIGHMYMYYSCLEWPILWPPRILTFPPGTSCILDTVGVRITQCFGVYIPNRTLREWSTEIKWKLKMFTQDSCFLYRPLSSVTCHVVHPVQAHWHFRGTHCFHIQGQRVSQTRNQQWDGKKSCSLAPAYWWYLVLLFTLWSSSWKWYIPLKRQWNSMKCNRTDCLNFHKLNLLPKIPDFLIIKIVFSPWKVKCSVLWFLVKGRYLSGFFFCHVAYVYSNR
jgi:hypothetical protein